MRQRIIASIACLLVFSLSSFACPRDEKYCHEHNGCVAAAHNCSNGVILSCVNETAPCADRNGSRYCVDVHNYTCGNISCQNTTRYCAESESCIESDESCCTDLQEACIEVMERASLFRDEGPVDMICDMIGSSNFSDYYAEIKQKNLVEKDSCDNGTYFCPLTIGCIPTNINCTRSSIGDSGSFDVFAKYCAKINKSFCQLLMHCIPKGEICSYKKLFDWSETRNTSIDLFGRACPENETVCHLTIGCLESCELEDVMGNKSCNGTPGTSLCPRTLQCGGSNETRCNGTSRDIDWTNVTDITASGWQDFCEHREVISSAFWENTLLCKPRAAKCKDETKRKYCDHLHELCEELHRFDHTEEWYTHELGNSSMANITVHLEGCGNVTIDVETLEACNISWNMSCQLHKLCPMLREGAKRFENQSMMNVTVSVGYCNVTINDEVLEICNISMNKSCGMHRLCHLLRKTEGLDDDLIMNRTIHVGGCNVTLNATFMHVCNVILPEKKKKSCKVHELCSELRDEIRDHPVKMNNTIYVEGCNITFNATTMHVCNIPMREKNKSCEIHKLCPRLHNMTKKYKPNSIVNRTVAVGECNITVNMTIVHVCNISVCELDKLCPELRNLTANYTKYSLPRRHVAVGDCNIKLNATALEEECNISLPSNYRYKMFFNGFKVSDSVGVGRIAVYELDVSRNIGIWKYKNGQAWTPLGAVSTSRAVILESNVYLRFITNDTFWHGLATLKYSVVESGATGSYVDVTSIPEDPRNTLSLLQFPRTPVANVTGFIGPEYTVPEDETTAGFQIGDKFVLNMTHEVSFNIPEDELSFLHEGVVEEYNRTVQFLESLVPAIAIISTGSTQEGNWKIGKRRLKMVQVTKPEVVTPSDSLSFVSARNKYGNWTMRFVAVVYSNISMEISPVYFDAPDSIAYALKGVMAMEKTSRQSRHFVESVLNEMAAGGTSYSLENLNGVIDRLTGSSRNKTEAKDIAAKVFERVILSSQQSRAGLPARILRPKRNIAILKNPTAFAFDVHVTPMNDQPIMSAPRLLLPAIAYNLTTSPNVGILVKDLTTKPPVKGKTSPLASDIDGDILGIAVVQAVNCSFGSWYYQAPNSQSWVEMIVNNDEYSTGQVEVALLTSESKIRFHMHDDEILWSNLEALTLTKVVFLAWDGSDGRVIGRRNITRPSEATSAYSDESVVAIVRRMGCDGKTGSKGKVDRCGICGGDESSCMGCDGNLNSGAVFDDCGNCTGGTTNLTLNFMKDCADECGLSFNDSCGYCKRKGSNQKFTDCAGICFGQAEINDCDVCTGGSSGKPGNYGKDLCGVCNGTNSTCTDCAGVPNGGKKMDMCDKCRLPSDQLFNNDCINLKFNLPESGPSTGDTMVDVKGAGLSRFTTVSCELLNQNTSARTASSSASFKTLNAIRVVRLTTPSLAPGNYKIMCQFDTGSTKYTVENTSFLVYNKSAISFTSVSPDEVLVNSAVVAHVIGVGFVDTPDLACVARRGVLFPATFNDATNVSCAIPATKKSVRLQLALSFSRADRVVTQYVNFSIVAKAPTPTTARFTSSLQGIFVTFNYPSVSQVKSKDCAMYFPTANVSKFGTRARCIFRTPKTMMIQLRGRPTIVPSDDIHFKTTSIKRKFQEITKTPTSQWKVLSVGQPIKPVVPTAVISGTSNLGLCAPLKLNGGRSSGSGGRRLKFTWFVEWQDPNDPQITANATADLQKLTAYFALINGGYQRKLKWKLPTIVIGPKYVFKLSVENFLFQTSANVSLVVQRENKQLPGLSLGTEKKTVKAALAMTLQAKIRLSSCLPDGYKSTVLFLWEINAVGIDLGVDNQPRLRIPPRTLLGGKSYTSTLTATMASDTTLYTTATIVLEVVSSPLRAIIKGGSMVTVGEADDTLVLDASASSDPDGSSDVASYNWLCFDMNDFPCYEPDPNNVRKSLRMVLPSSPKITIDVSSKLKTDTTYKFKMIFRKGLRESEADILVKVEPGTPPAVIIRPLSSLKINPTDKLIIVGLVKSKHTITASWSCVEGEDEFSFIDLDDAGVLATRRTQRFILDVKESEVVGTMALVINKDQLQNGAKYKLRLTAVGTSSYNDVIITTNAAPTQGTLTVDPVTGFFGNTTFQLSADEGWTDTDSPLSYQFGYYVKDEKTNANEIELLGTMSENNELEALLPPGDQANNFSLSIFVVVYDIYGARTLQVSTVIVRPVPIDAAAVTKFAEDVENNFESGDLAKATANANAVARALAADSSADASTTQALKDFKSAVTDMVLSSYENGGVQDESIKDVVKGVLLQMTSGCKPNCDALRVSKNLAMMEGGGQWSNSRRRRRAVQEVAGIQVKTGDQVETVLQIFVNVMDPRNYSNSSLAAKENFLSTIAAQEKSLCAGLATDGPPEIAKSNLTVIRSVKNSFINVDNDFLEVSTSTAPEFITATVTYRLGVTLKTVYDRWACTGDDTCTGMCIASAQFKEDLLILHDPSDKNLTRLSDIASLRLYNPETLAEVSVSGLASPVVLRFPIENAESLENYTKECRVWNDGPKEWQLSGCTGYETINTSIIECSCTQLGFITIFKGEKIDPTTAPPSTTPNPTTPEKPEQAVKVQFSFVADYSVTFSGNITSDVFKASLKTLLSSLLNVSEWRLFNMTIRNGSIIVSFDILPSNTSSEANVTAIVAVLKQLVSSSNINLTLPGVSQVLRVDPNSFKMLSQTSTVAPPTEPDDDGWSTGHIVVVVVVCSLAFIAIVAAVLYYILKVRPGNNRGKVSPKGSQLQLGEHHNNEVPTVNSGVNNNAVDVEKSV